MKTLLVLGLTLLGLLAVGFILLASAGEVDSKRLSFDQLSAQEAGDASAAGSQLTSTSASEILSYKGINARNPYLVKQAIFLGVALIPFLIAFFLDYHVWGKWPALTIAAYVIVLALLCFVLTQPEHKGARRWIDIGPLQVQPSEIAKMVALLATAVFLDKRGWKVGLFWKGALPTAAIFGLMTVLILGEPDFGSTVIVGAMGVTLMWMAGVKFWHILYLSAAGLVLVGVSLIHNHNRMRRLIPMLPESIGSKLNAMLNLPFDATSAAKVKTALYQKEQSIIAIQRGGITGVGFNQSQQKYKYLPERHTDFIFAIGAEEWGLMLSLLLLALFVTLFVCGVIISLRAPDRLGRLIAAGITFLIFFQAICNMGVVSGILPTKGLALPFISYGGTNLVMSLAEMGVLFNVGRKIPLQNQLRRSKISAVFNNN